ncbi:MAG: hypothetical protein ACPG8W_03310 [Candidatus Promineifilaceae bacterium]
MNAKRNIIGWGIFTVLALILSLFFTSPEFYPNNKLITLALPGAGDIVINEFMAIAGLAVIVVGAVIAAGIPLFFVYRMLDTTTVDVVSNDAYKSSVTALANREKDLIKTLAKERPAGKAPSHDESWWTAVSSALTIGVLFFSMIGAAFSDNFSGGVGQQNTVWLFTIVGLLFGFLTLNYKRVRASDESQSSPIDWGAIFIVMTGLLVVGLGVGVMMWVRSQTA